MDSLVSGSKRDAEDPVNEGETVDDAGMANLQRKRFKSHHGGNEELQLPLASRFLGITMSTKKSLATTITMWRTAPRTHELDVGSFHFRSWNRLSSAVPNSNLIESRNHDGLPPSSCTCNRGCLGVRTSGKFPYMVFPVFS